MLAEMMYRLSFAVTSEATELSLIGPDGAVTADRWPVEAPPASRSGVDLAQRLEAAGSANPEGTILRIEHSAIARPYRPRSLVARVAACCRCGRVDFHERGYYTARVPGGPALAAADGSSNP